MKRQGLSKTEISELKAAAKRMWSLGIDMVDVSERVAADETEITVAAKMTVYLIRRLPIDVRSIEGQIRRYFLTASPEVGQCVQVIKSGDWITVDGVNQVDHTFVGRDELGRKFGPYRFGDMGTTWRKG